MKTSLTPLLLIFALHSTLAATNELESALDLKPNVANGEKVYQLCATCHGKNGWGQENGSFPVIARQHRQVIIKQLADIRARNRENPTMFPFSDPATIGGEQAIADVAEYIQTLPVDPKPGTGDGQLLKAGADVYTRLCQDCHGKRAEGVAEAFFPRLQAQHFKYLKRQMDWMKEGRRKNANAEMVKRLDSLNDEEITAVADYISRISPD